MITLTLTQPFQNRLQQIIDDERLEAPVLSQILRCFKTVRNVISDQQKLNAADLAAETAVRTSIGVGCGILCDNTELIFFVFLRR